MTDVHNRPEQVTASIGETPLSDTTGSGNGIPGSRPRLRGPRPIEAPLELELEGADVRALLEEEFRVNPIRSALIALSVGFVLGRLIR
jgi:hypothetical protein